MNFLWTILAIKFCWFIFPRYCQVEMFVDYRHRLAFADPKTVLCSILKILTFKFWLSLDRNQNIFFVSSLWISSLSPIFSTLNSPLPPYAGRLNKSIGSREEFDPGWEYKIKNKKRKTDWIGLEWVMVPLLWAHSVSLCETSFRGGEFATARAVTVRDSKNCEPEPRAVSPIKNGISSFLGLKPGKCIFSRPFRQQSRRAPG